MSDVVAKTGKKMLRFAHKSLEAFALRGHSTIHTVTGLRLLRVSPVSSVDRDPSTTPTVVDETDGRYREPLTRPTAVIEDR